jgi:hypothetical protein
MVDLQPIELMNESSTGVRECAIDVAASLPAHALEQKIMMRHLLEKNISFAKNSRDARLVTRLDKYELWPVSGQV